MSMLRRVLDRESVVKSNLTDNLVDCVKELQLKYTAERGKTLTNDESTNTLCWILEAIFIHGLKNTFFKSVSSALTSSRDVQIPEPSFWEFVLIFCHQEVIVQINSLSHIHNDIGRCRAWLRLVLNDGLLISYIQLMLMDKKTLKYYFKPSAFLRDSERCDIMKSYLYGIESYDFQLATNSSLLNSWNSGPLSLIGLWTPADTVFQGVDVAENMDSKDLQAIPTLRSQSNTPPKPSFFPFEHAYRTPLLEEDEALRVILSSRASTSTYSEPRSSTSNASSRRSSGGHHSPLPSLTTAPQMPFAGSSTAISTKSENDSKKGQTKSKVNQEEKKERKRADKHENTAKPQPAIESAPVSINSGGIQNDGDHMFVSSTPICGPGVLSNRPELDEESCSEGIISCCPTNAAEVTTPEEEETSYAALFQSYNKSDSVIGTPITVGSFLDNTQFLVPLRSQNETTASSDPALGSSIEDNHSASITPTTLGFEILSHEETSKANNDSLQKDNSQLRRIANEVGLDEQNYKCRDCGRLVGMIYGAARVCWFTGYYYCTECHVNEEFVIPARILLNWDFAKYSVCKKSKEALQAAWEDPILDISEINKKLYNEVQECGDLLVLRRKLQSISIYLRTCKEPIMKNFKKDIWPKEYLYEEIHSYSLADLLNIPNRTLASTLTKLVNLGRNHIKSCAVCRQKGFVCEMCKDAKVIFPFDLEQIFKCLSCGAVYHNKCMNHSIACPRCVRWKIDSYATTTDLTSSV